MEVHHHPHVEKKNFKEYFLEFLMIFLAVTMGFFAENIREHISDSSKEKEYIINIKKDLIADTASLNIWVPNLFEKVNDYDSLISLLKDPVNTLRGSDMYYYARLSTRSRVFSANNNTITELKNSGNFRLISNKNVINGLMDFQKIIDSYINLSQIDNKEAELLYPLLGSLFDAAVFNTMVPTDFKVSAYSVDSVTANLVMENLLKPASNPQLRSNDKDKINMLIFYLHERKSSFVGECRLLLQQKKYAAALIESINKEYHL
ncbi:MAG: hypothetical protein JST87_17725 [Bacteroidetes bacterium]|nr:hypothetical protein [Bacteroidota bacterium]